jgi:catechol 2,3-dioxygenase-like lactoylglutathione lyase family enzyme
MRRTAPADAPAVHIWHVAFTVADLDRSIAFYCDALGFTLLGRDARSAFVTLGDRGFTLEFLVAGESAAARPDHLAFEAESLEVLRERLTASGVDAGAIEKIGPRAARMALSDPDGLRIDVFEARDEIEAFIEAESARPSPSFG